jgi:hypothetical protein
MAQPLQIKRGLKANLPTTAALGEPLIATDSKELYIGTGTSIYKVGDVIFSPAPQEVINGKIWVNTTDNTLHRASDDALSWIAMSGGAGTGTVTQDITVYGVTQGTYSDGEVITAGTSLEDVVKNMLQTIIPPTYLAPTLSISGGQIVEAGTSVSPNIIPTWAQRDGGTPILYTLKKDGSSIFTNSIAIPYADGTYVVGDTTISYQATEDYNQGPIKNDNQGNAYPTGRIPAGTATSNTVSYIGRRKLFYGVDQTDPRMLASLLGPANGTAFTINIPAGTTRVMFAYPATLRDVSSVKYVELGNGEVKDTFTQTLVDVEGAAGFTAIQYKVYTYIPAIPFGDAVTYQGVI